MPRFSVWRLVYNVALACLVAGPIWLLLLAKGVEAAADAPILAPDEDWFVALAFWWLTFAGPSFLVGSLLHEAVIGGLGRYAAAGETRWMAFATSPLLFALAGYWILPKVFEGALASSFTLWATLIGASAAVAALHARLLRRPLRTRGGEAPRAAEA